jgi:hypothetical protein
MFSATRASLSGKRVNPMPDCSLCGGPLGEDGGAVLFADARGIPFEVCRECESRFDALREAADDARAQRAMDYIFEKAGSMERRRDDYEAIVAFMEGCRQYAEPDEADGEEAPARAEPPESGPADTFERTDPEPAAEAGPARRDPGGSVCGRCSRQGRRGGREARLCQVRNPRRGGHRAAAAGLGPERVPFFLRRWTL